MARKLTQHLTNEACRAFCDLVIQVLIREGELEDEAPKSWRFSEAEARTIAEETVWARRLRKALVGVMGDDLGMAAKDYIDVMERE